MPVRCLSVAAKMTNRHIIKLADLESTYCQLVSVYRAVFTEPPYSEDEAGVQDFIARFPEHDTRGVQAFAAAPPGKARASSALPMALRASRATAGGIRSRNT